MIAKVIWSPAAKQSFDTLIEFLESKWEKKVIVHLFADLNNTLRSVAANPAMFPFISHKKKLRKCVLRKKTLLIYRIKSKNVIELVIFADTRQNPKKYSF